MGGGDGLWLCTEWKGTVAFVVSRTEPDSGAAVWKNLGRAQKIADIGDKGKDVIVPVLALQDGSIGVSVKLQNAPVAKQSSIFQAISCDMGGGDGLWLCTEWKGTISLVVYRI
ncbi:hypothetical protein ETH_00034710 [Eimeria tenella]|uniref:Uncharacterized protein n=1 Tax=Eimeria tenella TaxID=5802 RepID=U6KX26_EIMTE|nr:hypothetical protein ETH_00034710 [Eimeria tenella]CDJ41473.1 hypothetical protein ETH_00034710 [Eimeria tenella]|eukprot:XP_013232223.1 hypothetical protein ETH_00034710 [Eimeria tenella]